MFLVTIRAHFGVRVFACAVFGATADAIAIAAVVGVTGRRR